MTGNDGVTLTLFGRAELFDRYSGLTDLVGGTSAAYRHKFGIGYRAPWLVLSGSASYDGFRNSLRTSSRLEVRAEAGQRLTEHLDASAGVYYEWRYHNHGEAVVPALSGEVFDLAGQGAFLRAGYAPSNDHYFDVNAGVRRGDVESTSQPSLPIFLASSAIAEDPVWNDPNLYAYRLRGTTWSSSLAANYALSDRSSLDLACRYDFTPAAQGIQSLSNAMFLTLAHRY